MAGRFKQVTVLGTGNGGKILAHFFAKDGLDVAVWNAKASDIHESFEMSKTESPSKGKIDEFSDIAKLFEQLPSTSPRLFIFDLGHGSPVDSVLERIKPDLKSGDIILDCGNEHYRVTERRQNEMKASGVAWIGAGFSGAYQTAQYGLSMSLGGDQEAIRKVLPLFEKFAARNPITGESCVANVGEGGSGHYVKMVNNSVQSGILAAVCEAWALLHTSLGLDHGQIGDIFDAWARESLLKKALMIQVASEVCHQRKENQPGEMSYVLDEVVDKVFQGSQSMEGTLYWSMVEASDRHVAFPSIAASHFLCLASGNRDQRLRVADKLSIPGPRKMKLSSQDRALFIQALHSAVYCSYLCNIIQGLELISRASRAEGWGINLGTCLKVWRAGRDLQEGSIFDVIQPVLSSPPPNTHIMNIKLIDEVSTELRKHYDGLKLIVVYATEWDAYVPSMSATLEYIKYGGGKQLPTQLMEAELDYIGALASAKSRLPSEMQEKAPKTVHGHYEWMAA